MRAGRLDRRIDLQRSVHTETPSGGSTRAWPTVATVWAQVSYNRGDERFAARQIVGAAVVTFLIRYRADLTIEDRISYDGKLWDIQDIREVGRREGTEIDATAQADS